jgi:3-ketoacyl-CoA synthase
MHPHAHAPLCPALTRTPNRSWQLSRSQLRSLIEMSGKFNTEEIEFQDKIAYRTGLGDCTAVPPATQTADERQCGIEAARLEYATTCFQPIQDVLNKAGIKPSKVKFVITNSSLFNPTPSLSAAIINHFKLPATTINYSLGGMGCSAGVIALDLARELLCNHPNSVALVVSHENITRSYYTGAHGCAARALARCCLLLRAGCSGPRWPRREALRV